MVPLEAHERDGPRSGRGRNLVEGLTRSVVVEVPESYDAVALVGEGLNITRIDGNETVRAPGRPIAVVSNAQIQFQPAPAKKAPAPKKKSKARPR